MRTPKKDMFVRLFVRHNHHLFNFILTLVPNYSEAEDILQETAVIMWEKIDTFESGTNFLAWARKIARYKIANYYRTKKETFRFEDDLLETLSVVNAKEYSYFGEKKAALVGCLNKLESMDLELIRLKYKQNIPISTIARDMNKSCHTLYKRISFIYMVLQACIRKSLGAWREDV